MNMSAMALKEKDIMKSKRVKIKSKNQVTIPHQFCKSLNLEDEVDFIMGDGELILRPVKHDSGYFSKQILNELVDKGLSGEELKREFARLSDAVRPAIKEMIADSIKQARESMENYIDETDEIFGLED